MVDLNFFCYVEIVVVAVDVVEVVVVDVFSLLSIKVWFSQLSVEFRPLALNRYTR